MNKKKEFMNPFSKSLRLSWDAWESKMEFVMNRLKMIISLANLSMENLRWMRTSCSSWQFLKMKMWISPSQWEAKNSLSLTWSWEKLSKSILIKLEKAKSKKTKSKLKQTDFSTNYSYDIQITFYWYYHFIDYEE